LAVLFINFRGNVYHFEKESISNLNKKVRDQKDSSAEKNLILKWKISQ